MIDEDRPEDNRKVVLVDIDGTLSKVGDRTKCITGPSPNWDEFYRRCGEDKPFKDMFDLVNLLSLKYRIVFVSGRRESCRENTMGFLFNNCEFCVYDYDVLLRGNDDHRHDIVIKPELVSQNGIALDDIFMVLEDRNSMVNAWRKLGVRVLQVANGDF
jgi:hypothetical protein